jgi:lysophospholipase L1-like esterase
LNRLTIFAKGNLDVRDSLHSLRVGGKVLWNGINDIVRARFSETVIRLRHELWTRSDALLESDGTVPAELLERRLPLNPYSAAVQFSQALFETDSDVIILSLQPDITNPLVRHRRDGYLFYPYNCETWPSVDTAWLRNEFAQVESLDAETSMNNFARMIARVRKRSAAPILIYNLSSVIPGESVHCHQGLGDIFSTRIRRFNLTLTELSQLAGVSIIDVDTIIARAGADRLKLDAVHLTAEGCRLVAAEVARVLEDLGCFSQAEMNRCS